LAQLDLANGYDDQLRDALQWFDPIRLAASIPQRDHDLALIVRIDQSHEISQHDAVAMTESGSGQYHRGKSWILKVDGNSRGNQNARARRKIQRRRYARAQIDSRRTGRGVRGRRRMQPLVQNADL